MKEKNHEKFIFETKKRLAT